MSFTTKMFYYPRLIKAKLQMKGWFEQLYHTKIVFKHVTLTFVILSKLIYVGDSFILANLFELLRTLSTVPEFYFP